MMKLPLHISNGRDCFYLTDATGMYVAKSLGDSEGARENLLQLMSAMNDWEVFCQRTRPPPAPRSPET